MMPRFVLTTILSVFVATSLACSFSSSPASPSASASSGGGTHYTSELSFCIEEINRLRGSAGKSALSRSDALEKYAATAVQADALAGKAHTYALSTNFGNLTAMAENEALFWPLSSLKSVRAVVEKSLADMWREGPGGEHYDILVGDYTQVGCGVFVQGDRVAVLEAFR